MEIKIIILFIMIYLHIYDDFNKQGILAQFKQKDYWKQNYPDEMYKHDYIISLFMHSFSWSMSILVAPVVYLVYNNLDTPNLCQILILFFNNLICHMIVDHMKCNKKMINLVCDQLIHLGQIIITWIIIFM